MRKDKGLLFVDTHAGRGDYDLHPGDSEHPAEWQAGAAKLLAAAPRHAALTRYRDLVATGAHGGSLHYPGSPLLAVRTLRPVDRAVFFETQREEAGHLRKLCRKANARAWKARTVSRDCARCCRRRSGAAACSSIRPTKNARISRT